MLKFVHQSYLALNSEFQKANFTLEINLEYLLSFCPVSVLVFSVHGQAGTPFLLIMLTLDSGLIPGAY